jgi:uncharacterized protein
VVARAGDDLVVNRGVSDAASAGLRRTNPLRQQQIRLGRTRPLVRLGVKGSQVPALSAEICGELSRPHFVRPMSLAAWGSLIVVPSYNLVIALPTADRSSAYAFARALGLETPGELAEDGVPEPLRVQLNEQGSVMYVPTVGFGWITDGRATAESGTSECLLSLQVGTTTEVDNLVGRVDAAGGRVVSGPEQKAWGYTGTFTDPDGHLWEAIVSAI